MRLGIAGCGRIVERGYLPAALVTPGVEIVAFADPDRDRLERCREMWNGKNRGEAAAAGYLDAGSLLNATPIDLLVVAAAAPAHLQLAEEAAAAGIRALVEKPPALDLVTAERLCTLDPEPLIAFNRRFLQGPELRPQIPEQGWLELDLELRFRQAVWGAHEARDEALLDAGVHLIDLACHLSGSTPVAVRRAELAPERARLELELSRGRARISCAIDRRHRELVTVRDRFGKLLGRSAWGGLRGRLAGALGKPDPLLLSLRRQLEAARDLRSEPGSAGAAGMPLMEPPHLLLQQGHPRRSIATAREGATAMAVVEAARRSAQLDGAEITVAPIEAAA